MLRFHLGTVLLLGVGACFTNLEPNTEFPPRLQACNSLVECRVIAQQAQQDVSDCPHTVTVYMLAPGPTHLSCDDAKRNLQNAEDKVAKLQALLEARQQAESEKGREELLAERAIALSQQRDRQAAVERSNLEREAERAQSSLDSCAMTKEARVKRRKHAIIVEHDPGHIVQTKCSPRREMEAVQSQCTDSNGFVRTCTKQVAGDIVSYFCPETIDPDVAKLGLYQLGLEDQYPFPEDRRIPVRDEECDAAAVRLAAIREQLGTTADAGPASSSPANVAQDSQ